MTLATGDREASQEKASSSSVWPRAVAKASSFSTTSQFASVMNRPANCSVKPRAGPPRRACTCRSAGRRPGGRTAEGRRRSAAWRRAVALEVAHQQAVLVLAGDEGIEIEVPGCLRHHNLPGSMVGAADVADLADARGRRGRAGSPRAASAGRAGGTDRDRSSRSSDASGCPRRPHHIAARAALGFHLVHRHAEFGGKHDVLAPVAEDLPDGVSDRRVAINVGGVEQGDAGVKRVMDDRRGASRSMRPPKLLQPSPTSDTRRPDLPRLRCSMSAPHMLPNARTRAVLETIGAAIRARQPACALALAQSIC